MFQWLHDGGGEVGAATHRLCQDHIGGTLCFDSLKGLYEAIEVATEAAATHFGHLQCLPTKQLTIHQLWCLIVGNQTDPQALLHESDGAFPQKGGLSCAKETPYHDQSCLFHTDIWFNCD